MKLMIIVPESDEQLISNVKKWMELIGSRRYMNVIEIVGMIVTHQMEIHIL